MESQEAWEVIAGELPRHVSVEIHPGDNHWCIEAGDILCGPFDTREDAERHAWAIAGGRKAYAESIAPRLVREAAMSKFGPTVTVSFTHGTAWQYEQPTVSVRVASEEGPLVFDRPDICTAALDAIRALGGDA